MPAPTYTPPPTPPTSSDPVNFATRADAFLVWMAGLYDFLVSVLAYLDAGLATVATAVSNATSAASAAINASTLTATSGTSLSMGTGVKAVTMDQSGRTFPLNSRVTFIRQSSPTTKMRGYVSTAVSGVTVSITIDDSPGALGPFTDWFLVATALEPVATTLLATKANSTITTPIAKGNSGTGTVTFDVAAGAVQTVTNNGAHIWAVTWPSGHSELLIIGTNLGLNAITMPAGINWLKGDGTMSTTFSTMGVTLQTSGVNHIALWSPDGGTTKYGRAS